MSLESLFTIYGPLGLGWLFAIYLLRQNAALQERVMQAFIADTVAKLELKATLAELIERFEK